jgi:DNA-binding XRE family transcriptional regulator
MADIWGAVVGVAGNLIDDIWVTDEERNLSQAQLTNAQAQQTLSQVALVNAQNSVTIEAERTKRSITIAVIALGGAALLAGAFVFARSLGD